MKIGWIIAALLAGSMAAGYWRRVELAGMTRNVERAFQPAVVYRPTVAVARPPKVDAGALSMGLEAFSIDGKVLVRWNPAAPVFGGASLGKLVVIADGHESAHVLGPAQFRLGSFSCPTDAAKATAVRLEVALTSRITISEQAAATADEPAI
jgi:hypothetical protein